MHTPARSSCSLPVGPGTTARCTLSLPSPHARTESRTDAHAPTHTHSARPRHASPALRSPAAAPRPGLPHIPLPAPSPCFLVVKILQHPAVISGVSDSTRSGGASAARAARAMRPRGGTREARGEVRFWVLVAVLVALLSQVGRRARLARFIGRSRCALARALRQRGRGGPMRRACARRH